MKIKVTKRGVWIALGAILIVSVAIIAVFFFKGPEPITSIYYEGQIIQFRDDLRKADKIAVYPDETQIYLDTIHPLVKNVTIAFKDAGEDENRYYILEEFEIVLKMRIAYNRLLKGYEGLSGEDIPTFNAVPVENYANLPGKIQNPIIALVPPKYANETAVRNEGHVTYISGRTYRDFDLATIKFLMIVLGIDMENIDIGN